VSELVGAVLTRPVIDADDAASFLRRTWAIDGDLRPLPSERDRNFAVTVEGIDRFVLKISNASEDPAFLELQHAAMRRLVGAGVPCQVPIPTAAGDDVAVIGGERPLLARVLTWLPGRPLATIAPQLRQQALLADLGRVMGRTAAALVGFDHPAAHRPFQWSAEEGLAVIAAHAGAVADPGRAALLARWQDRLTPLTSALPTFRHGVIHNDANDHNVLVADDGASISGLLDLGDAVWSVTVNELAVASAYAALRTDDPITTISIVRAGFEGALPLEGREGELLLELVALRLATSVALSAHQSRLDPDDPYLTVSEAPAWALLERLLEVPPPTLEERR
jgi:Ser/Thr protein kinase RdoA (MazF antagonist)